MTIQTATGTYATQMQMASFTATRQANGDWVLQAVWNAATIDTATGAVVAPPVAGASTTTRNLSAIAADTLTVNGAALPAPPVVVGMIEAYAESFYAADNPGH